MNLVALSCMPSSIRLYFISEGDHNSENYSTCDQASAGLIPNSHSILDTMIYFQYSIDTSKAISTMQCRFMKSMNNSNCNFLFLCLCQRIATCGCVRRQPCLPYFLYCRNEKQVSPKVACGGALFRGFDSFSYITTLL